jgi:hypothetical protein
MLLPSSLSRVGSSTPFTASCRDTRVLRLRGLGLYFICTADAFRLVGEEEEEGEEEEGPGEECTDCGEEEEVTLVSLLSAALC